MLIPILLSIMTNLAMFTITLVTFRFFSVSVDNFCPYQIIPNRVVARAFLKLVYQFVCPENVPKKFLELKKSVIVLKIYFSASDTFQLL